MIGRRPGSRRALRAAVATAAGLAATACAMKIPDPPPPVAEPEPPQVEPVSLIEPIPDPAPPLPLAPTWVWSPVTPEEGALVVLVLEPAGRGMPILEVRAKARDADLPLAYLSGGGYLGLLPAPLRTDEITVEIRVTLSDGTKIEGDLAIQIGKREFPATRLRVASRFTAPDRATLERIQRERELVRGILRSASDEPLWTGAFILPLEGVTTSPYGQRRLFNNELRSQHTGLDVDGDTGDPVVASNSGRVVISRDLFFNGQAVFIDHGLGFYTGYFHLSKREVYEGQWVEKGDVVGLVGATGRVTGPHLHWGLYVQGAALDPLSLLDADFAIVNARLAPTRRP